MALACVSLPSVALSSCACLSLLCVLGHPHFWGSGTPFQGIESTKVLEIAALSGAGSTKIMEFAALLGAESTNPGKIQHFWVQVAHKSGKCSISKCTLSCFMPLHIAHRIRSAESRNESWNLQDYLSCKGTYSKSLDSRPLHKKIFGE